MDQKGFILPVLVVLVLVTLVGVGAFYIGTRYQIIPKPADQKVEQTPVSVSTPSPIANNSTSNSVADETANWKTYTDETSNEYSIQYPQDWYSIPTQRNSQGVVVQGKLFSNVDLDKGNVPGSIQLVINKGSWYENPDLDRVTKVFQSPVGQIHNGADILIKVADLKIDGYPAVYFTDEYLPGGQTPPGYEAYYAIKKGNDVYHLDFQSNLKDSITKNQLVIDQIAKSIKFK